MSKFIRTNFDDILLFPPAVEDWIPHDHKARFVRNLVRALNLSDYGLDVVPNETGRPAYHPEMMLMLWIYGYMCRIRSPRKIEAACYNEVGFIWLSGNTHPDHNTISRFFKDHQAAFKMIFKNTIKTAHKTGLIELALHALDGTKISSAISKKGASHRVDLENKLKHLDNIIDEMIKKTNTDIEDTAEITILEELQNANIEVENIRATLKELDEAETDHLNNKEPDARMMKLADGRTRFGYNCQAVRDEANGMVVAEAVVNDENDNDQLTPMIDVVKENLGSVAKITVADGGYFSGRELKSADSKKYGVLVNLKGITDNCKEPEYSKFNFKYNAEDDTYTCPKEKTLYFESIKNKEVKYGLDYEIRVYKCKSCKECPAFGICTSSKSGRRINHLPDEEIIRSHIKFQSEGDNKDKLKKRSVIIEPLFSLIKDSGGFMRFTHKSLEGAQRQWTMLCTICNLSVLYKKWLNNGINLSEFCLLMNENSRFQKI